MGQEVKKTTRNSDSGREKLLCKKGFEKLAKTVRKVKTKRSCVGKNKNWRVAGV